MEVLFLQYPKCTTCKKAKSWLEKSGVSFKDRHIAEENPTKEELKAWFSKSNEPIKKLFNTSGVLYKEMALKDKIPTLTEDELFEILSSNGMLVKRPLIVGDDFLLIGFKEEQWKETLLSEDINNKIEGAEKMDNKELVVETLKKNGAMKGGEIAEATGIDKKEVDKIIKDLKKDEKIISPKRCYYSVNE